MKNCKENSQKLHDISTLPKKYILNIYQVSKKKVNITYIYEETMTWRVLKPTVQQTSCLLWCCGTPSITSPYGLRSYFKQTISIVSKYLH